MEHTAEDGNKSPSIQMLVDQVIPQYQPPTKPSTLLPRQRLQAAYMICKHSGCGPLQARVEGAEAAAEEWREQQQELLKQVQQLEAQLAGLRRGRGGHKGGDASDASSSLKSELDFLKSEMRADLHSSLKAIEERWQERPGLPVAVPVLHAADVLHPCILARNSEHGSLLPA